MHSNYGNDNDSKRIKTILFVSLILTLALPVTIMNMVDAQIDDDQQRLATKKQNIESNFQQFLIVRENTDSLERELHLIEKRIEELSKNNVSQIDSLVQQRDSIQTQIDIAYQEIERLEKISNELHKIPIEKETVLENIMQEILETYKIHSDNEPDGLLEDIFISSKHETLYVIKSSENDVIQNPIMQRTIADMESNLETLANDYDIKIIVTRVIEQSSCNLDSERDDYCQPAASGVRIENPDPTSPPVPLPSTIGFPATRNSVSGFVTVGHAAYTMNGGEDLYQPTESGSNKFGDLVVGMNNSTCEFFDLSPGRTVDDEVVSNDTFNWDIDDYVGASGQTVGNFVYMSGLASGVEIGQIDSKPSGTNRIYADYDSADTDSGGPVGKVLSGKFDVYGIHEGRVEGDETLAQYVPYDIIYEALDLD